MTARDRPPYGVMAEFADAEPLVAAARAVHAAGYRRVDAYSPMHVDGLAEAIGFTRDRVAVLTLIGGVVGGVSTFALQWYSATIDYPFIVGGRPFDSWPAFVPATFEMTVLGAALFAFVGMLVLNGLPRLIHPVFNAPDFDLAARNRFFLCIQSCDARFDAQAVRTLLEGLDPIRVVDVPREQP